MIDLQCETLIEIGEIPRRLPRRASGKRIHISAVYRWVERGVRGVRLESICVGRTRYSSLEAIERFSAALSQGSTNSKPQQPTLRQRDQAQTLAAAEAARILGLDQSDSASARPNSEGRRRSV